MDDHLFVDPNDGMACHIARDGPYRWIVFLFDIDSGNHVETRQFCDIDAALAYVRKCLPNLTLPASETI